MVRRGGGGGPEWATPAVGSQARALQEADSAEAVAALNRERVGEEIQADRAIVLRTGLVLSIHPGQRGRQIEGGGRAALLRVGRR